MPRGHVADRSVGELDHHGLREGRGTLDRQAELDEDLAGKPHPGQGIAQRYDLHLGLERLAPAFGHVDDLVGLDQFQEGGRVLGQAAARDDRAGPFGRLGRNLGER